MEEEYKPEETVFTISHEEISKRGTRMCDNHTWRKLNDIELACTSCPTIIICAVDDERLEKASK